jgi:hypothetical protein
MVPPLPENQDRFVSAVPFEIKGIHTDLNWQIFGDMTVALSFFDDFRSV